VSTQELEGDGYAICDSEVRELLLGLWTSILWSVQPLLCKNRQMGGYSKAVSGQRLGKHVAAETDMNATTEELCFLCGPC
jgi:hypothetical protein